MIAAVPSASSQARSQRDLAGGGGGLLSSSFRARLAAAPARRGRARWRPTRRSALRRRACQHRDVGGERGQPVALGCAGRGVDQQRRADLDRRCGAVVFAAHGTYSVSPAPGLDQARPSAARRRRFGRPPTIGARSTSVTPSPETAETSVGVLAGGALQRRDLASCARPASQGVDLASARGSRACRPGPRHRRPARRGRSCRPRPDRPGWPSTRWISTRRALDVAEEPNAEPGALRGALDQARNVGQHEFARDRQVDDAEVGRQGGERIVGDLRLGGAETAARKVDLPALGRPTRPTSAISFSRSQMLSAPRRRGRDWRGAGAWLIGPLKWALPKPPLPPASSRSACRPGRGRRSASRLSSSSTCGADRHLQHDVLAVGAVAVAAHAVAAGLGLEVLLVADSRSGCSARRPPRSRRRRRGRRRRRPDRRTR